MSEKCEKYTTVTTTRRRANKHKVLPHGIPQQMFEFPDSVDALDFKVSTVCPILIKG